jgi:hypothetical protein
MRKKQVSTQTQKAAACYGGLSSKAAKAAAIRISMCPDHGKQDGIVQIPIFSVRL